LEPSTSTFGARKIATSVIKMHIGSSKEFQWRGSEIDKLEKEKRD
jgi:hypothetical protein